MYFSGPATLAEIDGTSDPKRIQELSKSRSSLRSSDQRSRTRTIRVVAVALLVLVVSPEGPAQDPIEEVKQCADLDRDEIYELYKHALVSSYAFPKTHSLKPLQCLSMPVWWPDLVHQETPLGSLSPSIERRSLKSILADVSDAELSEYDARARTVGQDEYLVCRNSPSTISLGLQLKQITTRTIEASNDYVPRSVVDIVLQMFVIGTKEELGIAFINSDDRGTVVAIRGTDFLRLSQVMVSVNDLLSEQGPCVSRVASLIVDRIIWNEPNLVYIAVTGHSLGGTVSQYIAAKRQANTNSYGSEEAAFRAFAFNAIGLRNTDSAVGTKALSSYYIRGDIVSGIGDMVGRVQGGTVVEYVPRSDGVSIDKLWLADVVSLPLWMRGGLNQSSQERVRRHYLHAVQYSLCKCLKSEGSVRYSTGTVPP